MNRSRSIPEELIKLKANQIWKKRLREGRDGTPESDWIEAKRYWEKHRCQVFLWRLELESRLTPIPAGTLNGTVQILSPVRI